ncbi:MAG: tetratricopeptide repeat protein [Jatrophihabitans sp.]
MPVRWSLPGALFAAGLLALAGTAVAFAVHDDGAGSSASPPASAAGRTPATGPIATDPIGADIAKQQDTVRQTPANYGAWADLGLDYVQQAKITVDPSYYPKAEAVLKRSLGINSSENYLAMAGEAALKAAEHDFTGALGWARRGLAINPYNATLYGSLNDALTQLGRYPEAFAAAQKMNDLQPGVAAFTRAEYVFELRGDIANARLAMQQALAASSASADKAFAYYYLAELSFNAGDPKAALATCETGLRLDPSYYALIQGKARAEAALGQSEAAVRDYSAVVNAVPQPEYVVEYGEYLQSLGRDQQAEEQFTVFDTENRLFQANGVTLDTDPTLYYANHGNPTLALHYGTTGIRIRPFIEMDDAYAWALHANHRDAEALSWQHKAMALGTRNALFYYHAGMINKALGNTAAAKADLTQALAINPYFSPLAAPIARSTLAGL